jgi:hypothetical protein
LKPQATGPIVDLAEVTPLRLVFAHGSAMALVIGAAGVAMAQAKLAPSNSQQERCIEAFAETPQEKAYGEAVRKVFACSDRGEPGAKCAVAVFGSEKAALAAEEKVRIAVSTHRLELLRKSANEDHLPSMYLLAGYTTESEELRGIQGLPTPEESSATHRTLYDLHFPLAARTMADECNKAIAEAFPDPADRTPPPVPLVGGKIQKSGEDIDVTHAEEIEAAARARKAAEARKEAEQLAQITERKGACLELLREAGFRGDMYAWERLADHYNTYYRNYSTYHGNKAPPPQPGIVPLVELYAWLELEKLQVRAMGWEDDSNVPRMHQEELTKEFMDDDQRRQAFALAEGYVRILWPRRIRGGEQGVCRLIPQFAGDPEPYGSDPSPR